MGERENLKSRTEGEKDKTQVEGSMLYGIIVFDTL